MISLVQPIPAGNALRVLLSPPVAASRIRLLRKDADTIASWDDAGAVVVLDGLERSVLDYAGLINDEPVWYRAFYRVGSQWLASASYEATPAASFAANFVDPLVMVRDRLELALATYVNAGKILHPMGHMPVLTASPQVEEVPLPLVTVHLAGDSPEVRAIGEDVSLDYFDAADGLWRYAEGALSRVELTLVGWSLNADERITLRNAMKAALLANLPVFDAAGMLQVSFNFTDVEDYETYAAPMYQAICTFSCLAFSIVEGTDTPVREVITTIREEAP